MLAYLLGGAGESCSCCSWRRERPPAACHRGERRRARRSSRRWACCSRCPYQEVRDDHPGVRAHRGHRRRVLGRAGDVPGGAGAEHDLGTRHRARARRARLRARADAVPGAARGAARRRSACRARRPSPKRLRIGLGAGVLALARAVARLPDASAWRALPVPRCCTSLRPGWDAVRTPGPAEHAHVARPGAARRGRRPPPRSRAGAWKRGAGGRAAAARAGRGHGVPESPPDRREAAGRARRGDAAAAPPADVRVRVAPLPRVVDERLPGDRQRARQLQAHRVRPARAADGRASRTRRVVAHLRGPGRQDRRAPPGHRGGNRLGGLAAAGRCAGRAPAEWSSTG